MSQLISSPHHPALDELCNGLSERAQRLDTEPHWPAEQLQLCAQRGVFRWFLPSEWGGFDWSEADVIRGYLRLSAACLTTTFIITQRTGACKRLVTSDNEPLKQRLLPDLASGKIFSTVGISPLTTSRRHLGQPVLKATEVEEGYVLDGYSPWVTGGRHAETIVVGATLDDGRQLLVALPTNLPGVTTEEPAPLIGLSASHTGSVTCRNVLVDRLWLVDGPVENVMARASGGKTGGLQTSTLAIGLSTAAAAFLSDEATRRPDLAEAAQSLTHETEVGQQDLLALATGVADCSPDDFRARANSLVLRTTQAVLAAAKGSGYVQGHPAGRWCREALFFLVWSCPQPVMAANLCELAGLSD